MNTIKKVICCLFLSLPIMVWAETKEIPFTLDDRDRIIRSEQGIESVDKKIDSKVDGLRSEMITRFENVDKRFDQLFNFLWAFIGIFTTMMVSVFGFAFWDRKLSLAPMKKENTKMLIALRDYAEHQPKLKEILRNAGLL